jgi:predicted porin
MKRRFRLAALSVTAALGAGAVAPAAAQSSVTVYGIVDLFAEIGSAGQGTVSRLESGGIAQSRLGFTGREDLGGGLAAEFTLESGFAADTGSTGSSFWSRQSHVGLASRQWGAVRFGHQYTPLFLTTLAFDAFGLGTAGNFWNLSQYGNFWQDNAVVVETPVWGGFSLRGLWAPSERSGDGSGRYAALSANYQAGPVQLVASVDQRGVQAGAKAARYVAVGGNVDFTAAKLFFGVQTVRHAAPAEAVNDDARLYTLGVHVPVAANGRIAASYGRRDDRSTANQDASQWALGYFHSLSKRTTLYSVAGRLANDAGGTLGIGYTPLPVLAGHVAKALQVGLQHTF